MPSPGTRAHFELLTQLADLILLRANTGLPDPFTCPYEARMERQLRPERVLPSGNALYPELRT